jgi:hypothetical protein
MLSTIEERISQELDVETLLKKVRDSHDMIKYLASKKQMELLGYNKKRVIQSSSS